jgi:hypothetical protein
MLVDPIDAGLSDDARLDALTAYDLLRPVAAIVGGRFEHDRRAVKPPRRDLRPCSGPPHAAQVIYRHLVAAGSPPGSDG